MTYREALENEAELGGRHEVQHVLNTFLDHEQRPQERYFALRCALHKHCHRDACNALDLLVSSFVTYVKEEEFKLFGLRDAMQLRAKANDVQAIKFMLPCLIKHVTGDQDRHSLQGRDFLLQDLLTTSCKGDFLDQLSEVAPYFALHVHDANMRYNGLVMATEKLSQGQNYTTVTALLPSLLDLYVKRGRQAKKDLSGIIDACEDHIDVQSMINEANAAEAVHSMKYVCVL